MVKQRQGALRGKGAWPHLLTRGTRGRDGERGLPFGLLAKSSVVAIVVIGGVMASGVAASQEHGADLGLKAKPVVLAPQRTHVPVTTTPPAPRPTPTTTSTSPPTTTLPPPRPVTAVTASPAPTTTTAPSSNSIGVSGTHLTLNGVPHDFVGLNAYEAATEFGTNAGCGSQESDAQLDQLFSSLPPNSLFRINASQGSMATDVNSDQINWGPLDRVFAVAAQHQQKLIVTLTGEGGVCDNMHTQDLAWFDGGFQDVFNDPSTTDGRGLTPLSYWSYLQQIVSRYRNSPALGMWEPISEPAATTCAPQFEPLNCAGNTTCPNELAAAQALRHFFDVVGGEIHSLDPGSLVESGTIGSGQCGTSGNDYQYVSASPGVDVVSYHDYYGAAALSGDQWNGESVRFRQAKAINKPIIAGELGIMAGTAPGCLSLSQRAAEMTAKMNAQEQYGASAFLVWNWYPSPTTACDYATFPGDPLLSALASGEVAS